VAGVELRSGIMSDLLPTFTYSEHRPTSKYRRDPGTRRTVGRSLDFEALSRFVDKVKSPGLEVAVGTAHVHCHRAWQLYGGLPIAGRLTRTPGGALPGLFLYSLVPVALGYVTAHYLTLLILEGQRVFITSSDPLSLGWDLFRPPAGASTPAS
jgi:hypothetical protein